MKTTLTLFILLAFALYTNAQTGYYTVFAGDTLKLSVTGANGTIQWQESADSISWSDIPGATTNQYQIIVSGSPNSYFYYRAKISNAIYCDYAWYSNIIKQKIISSTLDLQIGDWFHGGIVFSTDGSGNGLVAPQTDQTYGLLDDFEWGCIGTATGATSMADGKANTDSILAHCSTTNIAARICDQSTVNYMTDWFLPSKNQMVTLYQQKAVVGGFNGYYWNSTENNQDGAWNLWFNNGAQGIAQKNTIKFVRCIRSFSSTEGISKINSVAVAKQPYPVSITTQPVSQVKCTGSNVTFSVAAYAGTGFGSQNIQYDWKKDGTTLGLSSGVVLTVNNLSIADDGIYTVEVTNECNTEVSNPAELNVIQITADAGINDSTCFGGSVQLYSTGVSNYPALSGSLLYSWLPSAGLSASNIANPTASPAFTTDYAATVSDQMGCTGTDTVNVFVQNPYSDEQICLVTVDTSSGQNKILWEKTTDVGTQYYIIYKETALNTYSQIGNTLVSQPSEFIDLFSQPEVHADKYKISLIDTCGNESQKSYYHKTINLVIAAYGSTMGLSWNHYEDESGTFAASKYYIFRGLSANTLTLLDSISGSFTSYNDINVTNVYHYMIGVKNTSGCNTSKSAEWSFSNKKDNSTLVGINDSYYSGILNIYPNPFSESTKVTFNNPEKDPFVLSITDIKGVIVHTEAISPACRQIEIKRNSLKTGMYFVELKSINHLYKGKLVIE